MLIEEVNFENIKAFKVKEIIPVFFQYGSECFEIATSEKQTENAWPLFQKIFYSKFYIEHKEYIDNLFEVRMFQSDKSKGKIIFSRYDSTFSNELSLGNDTAIKFSPEGYIRLEKNKYTNIVVFKKACRDCNQKDLRLFVADVESLSDEKFKNEYARIKKQFTRKRKNPYQIKKANLVVGHINGLILSDMEKLIKYIRREFKKRTLLGDIIIDENQEQLLNNYMKQQLQLFVNNLEYTPKYRRVFALALVRYAMRNYNKRHSGDFWPYFKTDYGISIPVSKQSELHDIFGNIMSYYKMIYDDKSSNKIDNITMHSFVSDNSANQLFDYLFDFWRLDLGRNAENLNDSEEGVIAFDVLIHAISSRTQDVMKHTSMLLSFPKTRPVFKNRIRRIIKLINDSFWNDTTINETGNRINSLLNKWILEPKGSFQKEKNYVAKHSTREKGETMFHSPVLNIVYDSEKLKIVLPMQRLIECDETDNLIWTISNNSTGETITITPEYKHDRIGYYVERTNIEIPLNSMLDEFGFILSSENKTLKKYCINKSNIRFFDSKGKNIDYVNSNIQQGLVTSYSNDESYPKVLGDNTKAIRSDNLFVKSLDLVKGQVIVMDNELGVQVGQKLDEGLSIEYPLDGVVLKKDNNEYQLYNKLPKLLFKSMKDEIGGIALLINDKTYHITDKPVFEFKLEDVKTNGYLVDLNDYIAGEGLYTFVLTFPKRHVQKLLCNIAYIKNFKFRFIGAPYVFKEEATIEFDGAYNLIKKHDDKNGIWKSANFQSTFSFNFGDRNPQSVNYCEYVENGKLKLSYRLNNIEYPLYFDIPALYWRYSQADEWNTNQPADVLLKDLKNKIKKLYVSGPFNFAKSKISTSDDVDIADEESNILFIGGKSQYFEISKIYDWFKNDRTQILRNIYLTLNGKKVNLFDVVCKSRLNNVDLVGDFKNNILKGEVDIDGNESYTISIYKDDKVICEDEQIIDNKFEIETELETGKYQIYVYEVEDNDEDDGFDVGANSILLNSNPIVKAIINLENLISNKISIKGYRDLSKKYMPHNFRGTYFIKELEKASYDDLKEKLGDSEIYGIWNQDIDSSDDAQMSKFIYYFGKMYTLKFDLSEQYLMKVIVIFTSSTKPESILILTKDTGDDYGSLEINKERERIITYRQYKKMTREEQRKCGCLYDDQHYFIIEIEEDR